MIFADRRSVFPAQDVFKEIYSNTCVRAISERTVNAGCHQGFMQILKDGFLSQYTDISSDSQQQNAAKAHSASLELLRPELSKLKSNKTCLWCLMRTPEKVLPCGHALCNMCVRIFGTKSRDEKNTFKVYTCILCGEQNASSLSFQLVPPTAGTRILTLDGGGVKGVIPLKFLDHLNKLMLEFCCPLRDHFDLVCGTSSGGLIILGIFIMEWDPEECLRRFECLAESIFKKRHNGSLIFDRIQELLMSYFADCKYKSADIEHALQTAFGSDLKMFNPLNSDTKVAVTSTTARDSLPCLFSNYNGGRRPVECGMIFPEKFRDPLSETVGYTVVRAQAPQHDITVSEAYVSPLIRMYRLANYDSARCTSAAPWSVD